MSLINFVSMRKTANKLVEVTLIAYDVEFCLAAGLTNHLPVILNLPFLSQLILRSTNFNVRTR